MLLYLETKRFNRIPYDHLLYYLYFTLEEVYSLFLIIIICLITYAAFKLFMYCVEIDFWDALFRIKHANLGRGEAEIFILQSNYLVHSMSC